MRNYQNLMLLVM